MARASISVDDDDLQWLRAWAQEHHDGDLSAAIDERVAARPSRCACARISTGTSHAQSVSDHAQRFGGVLVLAV